MRKWDKSESYTEVMNSKWYSEKYKITVILGTGSNTTCPHLPLFRQTLASKFLIYTSQDSGLLIYKHNSK